LQAHPLWKKRLQAETWAAFYRSEYCESKLHNLKGMEEEGWSSMPQRASNVCNAIAGSSCHDWYSRWTQHIHRLATSRSTHHARQRQCGFHDVSSIK
jgi:hypothetical protein